jgi:hypothetical protein
LTICIALVHRRLPGKCSTQVPHRVSLPTDFPPELAPF